MTLPDLTGHKVAILSTDGFEQSELMEPLEQLRSAGADVTIIAPEGGEIKGWKDKDWGDSVPVDVLLKDAQAGNYHALVLPGGQMNPDILRANPSAVEFVREFAATGRPLAAICHAPWLLIEAGLADGRTMTSYGSIRTDLKNAGADVVDKDVAIDGNLITSRSPEDLPAFVEAIADAMMEAVTAE